MCDEQYDVSSKLKALFDIKQKERAAAKEYFQKLLYNPHRQAAQGVPFDPQLQRFGAMSTYHSEYFRPSAKHNLGFILYLTPIMLFYYQLRYFKGKSEELLRSGQVKYSDRIFKLVF